MMLLVNTIQAEVEKIADKEGWYRITGQNILHHELGGGACEYLSDLEGTDAKIHYDAKIEGIHGELEVEQTDPRFNGTYDDDEASFAVVEDDGVYTMVLDVNLPEFVLLQKLTKVF